MSMIFITGGAWQGKTAFAETLAAALITPEPGKRVSCAGSKTESPPLPVACGRKDPFETALERPVISGFHCFVRRLLREERDINAFIAAIGEKNPNVVITADELGCGIVPTDPEERAWREAAGRAAEKLAADSEAVYRMTCGIAVRLK